MAAIATSIIVLPAIVGIFIGVLILLQRRYPARPDTLVDAIDALLPQTQCAQCGYPGCRPYAEAISNGAALDQCPPGGADTQKALARLLERPSGAPVGAAIPVVARIDEQACIGCFLCVEACPVDAIVGAPKFMHTVIESRCTGCELCVAPCPVDCIELKPLPVLLIEPAPAAAAACIRCNRCVDACPEDLAPQTLWWLSRGPDLSAARSEGLDACIECGLCNDECPAAIDLVGVFKHARSRLAVADQARQRAIRARALADEREQRLEDAAVRAASRRARRLGALPDTPGPKEPAP